MVVSSLDTSNETWATFTGRLPYVGVAFLAGYASQEFLERLKAAAEALFSSSARAEEIRQRWESATSSPSSKTAEDVATQTSDNGT
jgi:hypothetical protein